MWQKEIHDGNFHCGTIRDQAAIAKYMVRAMRDRMLELPPDSFNGRLFTSSRDFFAPDQSKAVRLDSAGAQAQVIDGFC